MGQPQPLFVYFRSFQTNITNIYNKYMWKNVHPVYGAGIRTHDLWNESPPITTRPGLPPLTWALIRPKHDIYLCSAVQDRRNWKPNLWILSTLCQYIINYSSVKNNKKEKETFKNENYSSCFCRGKPLTVNSQPLSFLSFRIDEVEHQTSNFRIATNVLDRYLETQNNWITMSRNTTLFWL